MSVAWILVFLFCVIAVARGDANEGELGAGTGTSFTYVLPPLPVVTAKTGADAFYDVQITSPLPPEGSKGLGKSARPHLFVLAFALDEDRRLRVHHKLATPSALERGGDEDLIWSTIKLRNSTEGGLCFRVPMDRTRPSTLHILVASNYLGDGNEGGSGGGVPYRVSVAPPTGELRALPQVPRGYRLRRGHSSAGSSGSGSRGSSSSSSVGSSVAARAPPPRRVLCIDGGGSKGVIPLEMLAELERRSGVRTRDQFDLFCGTSTGSIVAAGIAVADFPVNVLSRLYVDLSRVIFGSRLNASQRSQRLRAIMTAVFGGHTPLLLPAQKANNENADNPLPVLLLTDGGNDADTATHAEASPGEGGEGGEKLFCAVATDMSTMQFRPYVFRNFVPGNDADAALHDGLSHTCSVVDALMSSTAAPTYFATCNVTVDGEQRTLTDGCLCANNPTHFALLEAAELAFSHQHSQQRATTEAAETASPASGASYSPSPPLQQRVEVDVVVSLGCGQPAAAAMSTSTTSLWGLGQAQDLMTGLFNLMTDTDMTHEVVRRMLQCQGVRSGEEYHRLNVVLDGRHMRIDESEASKLKAMQLLARESVRRQLSDGGGRLVAKLQAAHPRTGVLAQQQQLLLSGAGSSWRERRMVVVDDDDRDKNPSGGGGGGWLAVVDVRQWEVIQASIREGVETQTSSLSARVSKWRASVHHSQPLRGPRKSFARLTGVTGFFSHKQTTQAPPVIQALQMQTPPPSPLVAPLSTPPL